MDDNIFKIFSDTISAKALIKHGDRVLCALSGGADSVVLLRLILEISKPLSLYVEAAHVNHMIRGRFADRDEEFCRNICDTLGVKLHAKAVDVPALSKQLGLGIEECARNVRYEFFDELMSINNFDSAATAHNSDDNVETILFNFIRGASAAGLSGIPYRRGKIIRPILDVSKAQVLKYAKDHDIQFVHDSTNDETDYTRNFIRHELIPKIGLINPSFKSTIIRNSALFERDEAFILSMAKDFLTRAEKGSLYICVKRREMISLEDAVLSRVILLMAKELSGVRLDYANIVRAVYEIKKEGSNRSIPLTGKLWLEILGDNIFLRKDLTKAGTLYHEPTLPKGSFCVPEAGVNIEYEILSNSNNSKKINGFVYIDYDTITNSIFFRNRKQGDAYVPLGGRGSRSVKKMMIEEGVPRFLRDHMPVLCCGEKVIWVCGLSRINDEFKITEKTKSIFKINFTFNAEGNYFEY